MVCLLPARITVTCPLPSPRRYELKLADPNQCIACEPLWKTSLLFGPPRHGQNAMGRLGGGTSARTESEGFQAALHTREERRGASDRRRERRLFRRTPPTSPLPPRLPTTVRPPCRPAAGALPARPCLLHLDDPARPRGHRAVGLHHRHLPRPHADHLDPWSAAGGYTTPPLPEAQRPPLLLSAQPSPYPVWVTASSQQWCAPSLAAARLAARRRGRDRHACPRPGQPRRHQARVLSTGDHTAPPPATGALLGPTR